MILTCPDCATRYSAKGETIGPNGRTVRCSKCDATWFIEGEDIAVPDEIALQDLEHADDYALFEDEMSGHVPEEYEAEIGTTAKNWAAPGAHVLLRHKKEAELRGRKMRWVYVIWTVAAGVLAVVAAYAMTQRHDIVKTRPSTASLYQAVGLEVSRSGFGFEDVNTSSSLVDGQPLFIVNGNVRNYQGRTASVPLVELSFLDVAEKPIATWLVDVQPPKIAGGGSAEFAAQYPNPPLDAVALRYRFIETSAGER